MRSLKIFLSFAVALLSFTPCFAQSRVSFGESCNATVRCDSRAALTCANETCQCLKEAEMVVDSTQAKCVVLAGERCRYTAIEPDGQAKGWAESLACIGHASCNSDGFCGCDFEFYENSERKCSAKRSYEKSCEKDEECSMKERLICVGGKCLCNQTEAVYDRHNKVCTRKVGISNRPYARCVMNAKDDNCYWGVCHSTCGCQKGYRNSTEGLCVGGHNSSCDHILSPCEDGLSCYGGNCACHFLDKQVYNSELKKCQSKLNGPCKETVRGKAYLYDCIGEAECRDDHGVHECLCKEGYIKSKDNSCRKMYGSACTKHEECDTVPWAQLRCMEGICSCGDFQVYDVTSGRCLELVGADCSREMKCVDNAHCKGQRLHMGYSDPGICRCKPGYEVKSNRKCDFMTSVVKRKEFESEELEEFSIEI